MKVKTSFIKSFGVLLIAALLIAALPAGQAQAASGVVYNSIPDPLAPNYASQGFECCQGREFGDYVQLAGTARELKTITVTMSIWALQSEYPTMTDPTGWDHPITLNIYNVTPGDPNALGTLIASKSQVFHHPWRPVADPTCPSSGYPNLPWRASDGNCYNGYAYNITFDFSTMGITLPDGVVLGVAFNTEHYGYTPTGVSGPYNSLNVAAAAQANVTVGVDGNADKVFFNSLTSSQYADGGATGTFREDTVGWGEYGNVPFQIKATSGEATCTTECYVDAVNGDDTFPGTAELPMKTIQKGIDTVTAGGTVNVYPGTYVEGASGDAYALELNVSNITVKSTEGRDVTTVDAGGATSGVWALANLGDVTFDGFTVENFTQNGIVQSYTQRIDTAFHVLNNFVDPSNGYLRNGLQVSGDGSTVFGNIVYGAPLTDEWASTGIGVINANNVVVKGNTVQQDIEDATNPDIGINVMNYSALTSNVTIEQNIVTNAGDGIRISAASSAYVVENVIINNNIINENTWGINVQKVTLDGVTVTNNTIQSNYDDLLDDDGPLYGSGIRFSDESATVTNASITGNTFSDNETYQVFGHAGALINVPAVLSANTFDNAVTIDGDHVIYSSIQDAIDDASAGDTINVAAGTYAESYSSDLALKIDKPISLIGTGLPTVDGNLKGKVVQVTAGDVTISGMKFVNADADAGVGIYLFGVSNTVISSCESSNNKIGLLLAGVNGSTIENNAFVDNSYRSIVIQQNSDSNVVKGNTVTMSGPDTLDGIVIGSDSGDNTIGTEEQPNSITMSQSTTLEGGAHLPRAIYLTGVGASNNVIQYNNIDGSASAIQIDGNSGITTVDHNTIGQTNAPSFRGVQINGGSLELTNNTIKDSIRPVEFWDAANVTITGNTIDGTDFDFINVGSFTGTVIIEENAFVNITGQALRNQTATSVDASPNWWGSAAGPAAGQIVGDVTYIPWCGDASCTPANLMPNEEGEIDLTPPVGEPLAPEEIQTAINNAPEGSTIIIPAGEYGQVGAFEINTPHITITLSDGTVIQNSSPCFDITASYTTITGNGAVCVPTDDSNGIDVAGGLTNIIIEGLEIDGSDQVPTAGVYPDGIAFAGAITDLVLRDNFIHDLDGDGVFFGAQPVAQTTGAIDIHGNLFQNNGGVGVTNPNGTAAIDATYNSWGDVAGPAAGDGVGPNVTATPYTHVDVYLVASGTPWTDIPLNQVVSGETITFKVMAHVVNALTVDVKLAYPTNLISAIPNLTATAFPSFAEFDPLAPANTIWFHGMAPSGIDGYLPVTGDVELFTVTFAGGTPGLNLPMNLDELSDVFGMEGVGSSTNIYAVALLDSTVNVIDLPVIDIVPVVPQPGPYTAGLPIEFNITVTNVDGGNFTDLNLDFTLPTGALLQYWDGDSWETVIDPMDIGTLAPEGEAFVDPLPLFRVIFAEPPTGTISVALMDLAPATDFQLATTSETFDLLGNFTITGTFSMQGRSTRAGIPVTLDYQDLVAYTDKTGTTINQISYNLSITDVNGGNWLLTTNQARYLNVIADNDKIFMVDGNETLNALQLLGGNADYTDNEIDVDDASVVGTQYGGVTGVNELSLLDGDCNFDGKVNVQDLALVGGNFDETSESAYGVGSNIWSIQ